MTGKLIIAKPYLGDPNFERSVVLICEHSAEGAFGLVLNQPIPHMLSEFEDIDLNLPVNLGGPVEKNTLHFIHKKGDMIENSIKLREGLYWSGNFSQVIEYLKIGVIQPEEVRFFVGYSGWGEGQLEDEFKADTWVLADTNPEVVFEQDTKEMWRMVLRSLGGEFKIMSNSPEDPRLN